MEVANYAARECMRAEKCEKSTKKNKSFDCSKYLKKCKY